MKINEKKESETAQSRIRQIFDILEKETDIPAMETDFDVNPRSFYLEHPYTFLVMVILSARAIDQQVNRATKSLFEVVKTPQEMLELGLEGLYSHINKVGIYKSKGVRIVNCTKILIEKHNSQVPETREELMALPGIGRKSADVVLNFLYQKPVIGVDTHVFRVATRLELAKATSREKMADELEQELPKILSEHQMQIAQHLLVLHGRYTCKAQNPNCGKCPLYDLCRSKDKIVKAE